MRKFVLTLSIKIPLHLKCVATLPRKCQKVMVSVGVSRMGKTGIVFVEPESKVNSEHYCICARCQRYSWTLQQDGAPSHTARYMYTLRLTVFAAYQIEPDMWPPNSTDLNPVDYAVWGALQSSAEWSINVDDSRQSTS